ncbi:MAG: type II secretion system protein [Cyanobacteria bacterium P01_F01_bin.150]
MQRSKRHVRRRKNADRHGRQWRWRWFWCLLKRLTLRSRWRRYYLRTNKKVPAGFTLLETLTVMAIMGILMAIASAPWLSFLNTSRLNAGQDQLYQIMRIAQSKAKHEKRRLQVSFRNHYHQVQWVVHPTSTLVSDLVWQTMPGNLQIDPDETTLYRSQDDVYRLQFNHQGHVNGRLGRLTIKGSNAHRARRCVFASTLIGTLRKAKDQRRAVNGRHCY